MKRTRHSAEQIVSKLREAVAVLATGRSVAQIVQALSGDVTPPGPRNGQQALQCRLRRGPAVPVDL